MSGFPKGAGVGGLVAGNAITLTPPSTVGVTPGTYVPVVNLPVNLQASKYGAVIDAITATDVAMTSGQPTVTSASITAAMNGRKILVTTADRMTVVAYGTLTAAGTGTATLTGVGANATQGLSGGFGVWGTVNTTALNSFLSDCGGRTGYFPDGAIVIDDQVTLPSSCHLDAGYFDIYQVTPGKPGLVYDSSGTGGGGGPFKFTGRITIHGPQYGVYTGTEIGFQLKGTVAKPVNDIDLQGLRSDYWGLYGLFLWNTYDHNLENLRSQHIRYAAYMLQNAQRGVATNLRGYDVPGAPLIPIATTSGVSSIHAITGLLLPWDVDLFGASGRPGSLINIPAGGQGYGIAFSRDTQDTLDLAPRTSEWTIGNSIMEGVWWWEGFDSHAGADIKFDNCWAPLCGTVFGIGGATDTGGTYQFGPKRIDIRGGGGIHWSQTGIGREGITFGGAVTGTGTVREYATGSIDDPYLVGYGTESNSSDGAVLLYATRAVRARVRVKEGSPSAVHLYHDNQDTEIQVTAEDTWSNTPGNTAYSTWSHSGNNNNIEVIHKDSYAFGRQSRTVTDGATTSGPTTTLTTAGPTGGLTRDMIARPVTITGGTLTGPIFSYVTDVSPTASPTPTVTLADSIPSVQTGLTVVFNPQNRQVTDAVTDGAGNLSSDTANFTVNDIGRSVTVGAGTSYITQWVSATAVITKDNLAAASGQTLTVWNWRHSPADSAGLRVESGSGGPIELVGIKSAATPALSDPGHLVQHHVLNQEVSYIASPVAAGSIFAANGSYTVPSGVNYLEIICVGGGGGGGGAGSSLNSGGANQAGGGGGGSGAVVAQVVAVTAGTVLTVTVGAGGTGGSGGAANGGTGNTAGGTGGSSSVTGTGVSITAVGGTNGARSAANSATNATGGTWGGGASGSNTNVTAMGVGGSGTSANGTGGGGPAIYAGGAGGGGAGMNAGANGGNAGAPGSMTGGGAGGSGQQAANANGATASDAAATSYGAGGGGGGGGAATGTGGAGGKGGPGLVIIRAVG